jgi:hypothetical protein
MAGRFTFVLVSAVLPRAWAQCSTLSQAQCGGTCHWDGVNCRESCFDSNSAYGGDMPGQGVTTEASLAACRTRCYNTNGCAHFTYYSGSQNCHLNDNTATKSTVTGATTGDRTCTDACDTANTAYNPTLAGTSETTVASSYDCRERCRTTNGCRYYTFMQNTGGCRLSGNGATRTTQANALTGTGYCGVVTTTTVMTTTTAAPVTTAANSGFNTANTGLNTGTTPLNTAAIDGNGGESMPGDVGTMMRLGTAKAGSAFSGLDQIVSLPHHWQHAQFARDVAGVGVLAMAVLSAAFVISRRQQTDHTGPHGQVE